MRALWIEDRRVRFRADAPEPPQPPGEAIVRVSRVGVCGTDLALLDGLYPFTGVPGHEFVGVVERGPREWIGRRVVGEINATCGRCRACREGAPKHCERRTALGIRGRSGALAERLALPVGNLHAVPEGVGDDAAAFAEPLAAALDVLRHVDPRPADRVLVVGPGRLGQLVCRVLRPRCAELVAAGQSPAKLARLGDAASATTAPDAVEAAAFDLAVECSGTPAGVAIALAAVRARGTVVLKSTFAATPAVDLARVVVDEVRLVGSRCGPFAEALALLPALEPELLGLVDGRYPLEEGAAAFAHSRAPGAIKILVDPG